MPALNCGLTLIELPPHSGVFTREAGANFNAVAAMSADITPTIVCEATMEAQATAIGVLALAQYGGTCNMGATVTMEGLGIRQGPDGAIPVNFQRKFY